MGLCRNLLAACLFCLVGVLSIGHAAEGRAKHVVVICVDGLPAYLLKNPNVPLTNIRSIAARGVMAEGMIASNPSVTWPNHTSIVTGVRPETHGVLFNGVLERGGLGIPVKVNSRTDKSALVHAPTIYDVALKHSLTSVGINWPCTRNSQTLKYDFPDSPDTLTYTTPALLESMKADGLWSDEMFNTFPKLSTISKDRIWTQAACHLIKKEKPNLTLVHLLNVDGTHHRYGPLTDAGYAAVAYADSCVGDILDAIDEAGIREQTTVMIVSDHGFISIPQTILPNVALRKAGLLTVENNQIATANAMIVPEGGIAMLYLTRPDTADADRKKVIELFKDQEGILDVVTPDQFSKYGFPQPDEYPQMADLVLAAKDGYGFAATATGDDVVIPSKSTLGTHGYLSTNPKMNATFVAAGAGIRNDVDLGIIENINIAATIAQLLNFPFESAKGEPLTTILKTDAKSEAQVSR